MNREADKHIERGVRLAEKGDGFYAQAADEIIAAQRADSTLSNREIATRFDRSEAWIRTLVRWRTTASSSTPSPYSGQADEVNLRKTKQLLREDPERVIQSLPSATVDKLADAALNEGMRRRQGEPFRFEEPTLPHALLRKVESDRRKILAAVQLMVGHWHDHRHDANEEEVMLARDTMAETVIEVEQMITSALRQEAEV